MMNEKVAEAMQALDDIEAEAKPFQRRLQNMRYDENRRVKKILKGVRHSLTPEETRQVESETERKVAALRETLAPIEARRHEAWLNLRAVRGF